MTDGKIDLATLRDAVAGGAVAIRATTRLEAAGGTGDKVFPPTYKKAGGAATKYAIEQRVVDGRPVQTVLLDSVASQANRIEEALLEAWRRRELSFPLVTVDFRGEADLQDLGEVTALQAPHRIADAIFRDSLADDGTPFRNTLAGRRFTDSRPNHATGMYAHCPTAIVFGVWDSTGPRGGMGAKFQRCLVSEIIGFDVLTGVKTASRIDPLGIQKNAARIYEAKTPGDWTHIEADAVKDGKTARLFRRSDKEDKDKKDRGTPATINHGNIPPSIDTESGGVTMSHARHSVVLSLAGLRRLRFTTDMRGEPIPDDRRDAAETAARTALAALALAGVVYQREQGYDLRSRSLLVPTEPLTFELLSANGGEPRRFTLDRAAAAGLVAEAASAAAALGLGWDVEPIRLKPTPKLAHLVRKSRELTAAGEAEGDE